VVAPAGVARVELKNTDAILGGEGFPARGVQHHILIHSGGWAVIALELGRHVAKPVLAHIEVGAIEPMGIGVLVWHEHFGHGDFVSDGSEPIIGDYADVVENRALAWVKAKMELPVLPVDLASCDGEISSLALLDGDRFQCWPRVECALVKLDDLKVIGWCISISKRVCDFDEFQFLNIE